MNDRITARELRIGNLVNRPNFGLHEITQIKQHHVQTNRGALPFRAIEGIPLTGDWLKKFGFKYEGGDGYFDKYSGEHFYFSLRNGVMASSFKATHFKGCQYVHQLQNLYFSLTGEELTIKETAS